MLITNVELDGNITSDLEPKLKVAFVWYFSGKGHIKYERIDKLIPNALILEQLATDNEDPLYYPKRFIKVVSGMDILPPKGISFTVGFS